MLCGVAAQFPHMAVHFLAPDLALTLPGHRLHVPPTAVAPVEVNRGQVMCLFILYVHIYGKPLHALRARLNTPTNLAPSKALLLKGPPSS